MKWSLKNEKKDHKVVALLPVHEHSQLYPYCKTSGVDLIGENVAGVP